MPPASHLPGLVLGVLAALAGLQSPPPAPGGNEALAEQRQAIFVAEDSRAPSPEAAKALLDGVASDNPRVQQMAVRALGRLEREEFVPTLVPLLAAASAAVRGEAANALAQIAQASRARRGGGPANAAPPSPSPMRLDLAREIRARLQAEPEAGARGVLCQALGRLPHATADEARESEAAVLAVVDAALAASRRIPLPALAGAVKGLESLFRGKMVAPSPATLERLAAVSTSALRSLAASPDAETVARIRRLALTALGSRATEQTLRAAIDDPDAQVRRLAVVALGTAEALPRTVGEELVRRGLQDRSPMVRYEALRVYGRLFQVTDQDPVMQRVDDAATVVSLLAIDLLGNSIDRDSEAAAARLTALSAVPLGETTEWHRPAHALVSLAKVSPDAARRLLPQFAASPQWPARVYAARAAAALRDTQVLERLALDARDTVRDAALNGLATVSGHAADAHFIAALGRSDYQVVLTACRALRGSPSAGRALPALVAALGRITAEKRETSRDPRLALIDRIAELGTAEQASALAPYLRDFDPRVAERAAAAIGKWTGTVPDVAPQPLPITPIALDSVERERDTIVRVTLAGRGTFEVRLLTSEAPASAARFVALAEAGYYDGLTFHRLVPNFVLQGGSPGANEYVGEGRFQRDELGLQSNTRGTLGVSTRGRDTGDAQVYVNLCDNPRLDHEYTVFATITSGLDVVDRILEFDVIERIELVRGPSRSEVSRGM